MFNVGSEDKEKLRENMEEIKNLIQGKEDNSSQEVPSQDNNELGSIEDNGIAESNLDDNPPLNQSSGNNFEPAEQDTSPLEDNQNENNIGTSIQNDNSGIQNDTNENNLGGNTGAGNNFNTGQDLDTPEQNQQFSQDNSTENLSTEDTVNNSPKQSQKLFLEVERFEKVKDMIDEMQQLTQDIETTSQDLEDQIEEERESENVAQQLLDNFDDRKREVEGVVLDSEEN